MPASPPSCLSKLMRCRHDSRFCNAMPTTQIILRNVDPELLQRLRAVSAERGESLNSTVLHLLKDAVGLDARRDRLRRYVTWTTDDLAEFTGALRAQRIVDER